MKTRLVPLFALLTAAACNQTQTTSRANLIGTLDLVLADELAGGLLAGRDLDGEGKLVLTGVPSRFLFITSADTNELRVLENFRTLPGRNFVRAPNPNETLSIPVLDRPTMLAVDEGRNALGQRVTGSYVYAARPGGAEVSVVSVTQRRQLGARPMATPAPLTALAASLDVDRSQPALATELPATTRLYIATWDGTAAAIFSADLPTGASELDHLDFQRVLMVGPTPIAALLVVSPFAGRTADGAPFCDAKPCLAIATRSGGGKEGRAFVIDPQSGRLAYLAFSGPVHQLVSSGAVARIYGVLDEQACGAPPCGGVVAVDTLAATTATTAPFETAFPGAHDALGLPWRPLRSSDGLITGLSVAAGGAISQSLSTVNDAGTETISPTPLFQQYDELGAIASSTGTITFFSGLGGSIIDYDALRANITSASVRLPGPLADGGLGFALEDGGVNGSNTVYASHAIDDGGVFDLSQPWRTGEVSSGASWTWDLSDGYLQSQSIAFVYEGQLPGLVNLPTSAADGLRLATGGYEVRAMVNDVVLFFTADGAECGRSTVATIGSGFIEAAEVPAGCEGRAVFSVRAAGPKLMVVAADIEGYLGRWALGETLTYSRPYVLLTAGVTSSRTALTIVIPPTLPDEQRVEGAYTSFQVNGHMAPYQVGLDTLTLGSCASPLPAQTVIGNLVLAPIPTSIPNSSALQFSWTVFGVVPSGNALVEIPLQNTSPVALGSAQAICWR